MDIDKVEFSVWYERGSVVKLDLKTKQYMSSSKELNKEIRLLNRRIVAASVSFENRLSALKKAKEQQQKIIKTEEK